MTRPLIYNAFVTNNLSHIHHGAWRRPTSQNLGYNDLATWISLATTLDAGGFDAIFFADTFGAMEDHSGGWRTSARHSVQFPAGDPLMLVPAMAAATRNLGFVVTGSILAQQPYLWARTVSTLDHLTNGRFGWNVVTSTRRSEARALGLDDIPSHADRYAQAQEFLEITYKLWETSWQDDAVSSDPRAEGRYLDESKVHEIHHRGARYRMDAVHQQPPSPQRTPVIFQAGGSPIGRDFAARHAEGTFIAGHDPASATAAITDIRARARAHGRPDDDIRFIQGMTFVVGSTEEEARRLSSEVDDDLDNEAMLAHMSGTIGLDLGAIDLDAPFEEFTSDRTQGVIRGLVESAPGTPKTFRDLSRWAWSQRVVGTPETIADEIGRWAAAGVDGLNIIHIETPGTYVEFIDHVAPVLRARGLMRAAPAAAASAGAETTDDAAPVTLRERLFPGRGARLPASHPARAVLTSP